MGREGPVLLTLFGKVVSFRAIRVAVRAVEPLPQDRVVPVDQADERSAASDKAAKGISGTHGFLTPFGLTCQPDM